MAFCGNCGAKVEDGKKFCPECGAAMGTQPAQTVQPQQNPQPKTEEPMTASPTAQEKLTNLNNTPDITESFDPSDIEANKVMAVLAYILFLIPLLAAKESPYAKFHTNQGLVLFLAAIIVSIVGSIIPILGWFIILPVGCLIVGVIGIIGIINAVTGKAKELPLIGKFRLIK